MQCPDRSGGDHGIRDAEPEVCEEVASLPFGPESLAGSCIVPGYGCWRPRADGTDWRRL